MAKLPPLESTVYQLDIGEVYRYVDAMGPGARATMDRAITTTIEYMFGIRNGACSRYERDIQEAVVAIHIDWVKRLRERREAKSKT